MATGLSTALIAVTISVDETNYLRAAHLVIDVCPRAVRNVFDRRNPPSGLTEQLAKQKDNLKKCRAIFKSNWPKLFPSPGSTVCSSSFDLTLLMALLRNFTSIPCTPVAEPSTGWDTMPAPTDHSEGADLVRIKLYRNKVVHVNEAKINTSDFNQLWTNIGDAIHRLSGGSMRKEVDDLLDVALDQSQNEVIMQVIQNERDIKELKMQTIPMNIQEHMDRLIEDWRNDDTVFCETSGYKGALELLNRNNYITIIAGPGAGKSATAKHIALKLENDGWDVVPVDEPNDIISYGSFDKKQVFVIDDVVGVFNVEISRLDAILQKKEKILNLIQNQTKLIMTCRKVVYNEARKSKPLLTDFVVDLENGEFRLKENEKKEILLKHCLAAEISQELYENIPLANAEFMFPLLCKIFSHEQKYQRMGQQFFENPNECLLEKMEDLKERNPLQYAGLILLCLKEDKILSNENICESDKIFGNLKREIFDIYDVNHGTPKSQIIKAMSLLDGTYTRPSSGGFTFIHDSIFELVAYHHGISYPKHILKYSSSTYVNNRVTVDDPPSDDGLYIKIDEKHYQLLAKRILQDIKTFELCNVFKNSSLKNGKFLDAFIKILRNTKLKAFKEIFVQSHPKFQKPNANQESDTSDKRAQAEANTYMLQLITMLLESDDTRVIRWLVFYGPTRLFEFVINRIKRQKRTFRCTADRETAKDVTTELLFGDIKEQIRILVIGCFSGDVDRVRMVLQYVDPSYINESVDTFWLARYTPLTAACHCGHLPVIKFLIQYNAGVDVCDSKGKTPLYIASGRGHCDIVMYLISHGADPNKFAEYSYTPLFIAIKKGHFDIVRYLIDHGANPDLSGGYDGNTPLYIASEEGQIDIVRYLIDHDADPNICGEYGNTPLRIASDEGHSDIVKYLIDHGADPNKLDKYGRTPLSIALEREHWDIVMYLIDHHADPNISDVGKINLFYRALHKGCFDVVRYLIDDGVDPDIRNEYINTPLYVVSREGYCDIVRLLINHDANPNLPGRFGKTPLHLASEKGHFEIVRYLIDHDANPDIPDQYGKTPLCIASEKGHLNIVEYLENH